MVETCPTGNLHSNYAGGGYGVSWTNFDANYFHGHVTVWKRWVHGKAGISVKICDADEMMANGYSCHGDGAAWYPDIYGSNACSDGHNCMFKFVSDIWNGHTGDSGFEHCTAKHKHPRTADCKHSVRNIKVKGVKGPIFSGKCAPLNAAHQQVEVV